MSFTIHDHDSAPAGSKALLQSSQQAFGMIPNLHGVFAESPQALEAYQRLHGLFADTAFDADELTVIWMTINVEHECHYCIPAHTAIAHSMKVDTAIIDALRQRTALPSAKLQTLHETTLALVRNRGRLSEAERERFHTAGYGNRALLDIVLGIAQKVMSNYTNHLADTPIDTPFQRYIDTA